MAAGLLSDRAAAGIIGAVIVVWAGVSLVASFVTACASAVMTFRHWPLLSWPGRAIGLAGWLIFSTEFALPFFAMLA